MVFSMAPALPGFHIEAIDIVDDEYLIVARAIGSAAICPDCAGVSPHVHSWYERLPRDLPSCGLAVRLCLQVRRFFCRNSTCPRKVFCERLPQLLPVYARRTARLAKTLMLLAFALGGEYGARLVKKLGMPVSRDTLLRLIRRQPLSPTSNFRVIGVDDWAFRKGHNYGTIICDLELSKVIDLLPDREAETLADWLKQHPTVEVIARDRSKTYAEGARSGAPKAIQVADRWHLIKNLVDAVGTIVAQHPQQLTRIIPPETDMKVSEAQENHESLALRGPPHAKLDRQNQAKRQARLEKYNRIRQLREKGLTIKNIAKRVGLSHRTVQRWLAVGSFPERKRRTRQPTLLDPYLEYLDRRWEEGCHNATKLWRELQRLGFSGKNGTVHNYIGRRRHGLSVHKTGSWSSAPIAQGSTLRSYSPRRAAVLFVRREEKLDDAERDDLAAMKQDCSELATTYALAQRFVTMIRKRDPTDLELCLEAMRVSGITELKHFATNIDGDRAEVTAALTYAWSNGPVEGHVNRLKMIKRQMFGRANFDLLRQRVLYRL
jgi:transposase